ncbi:hypothetical protein CFE70_003102 [Pyrenophora teres f. teres 0-1]|uniref:Uncharacterized protein n=1 Tax=Pyrenophora teres f. teres (strain 0-1) TaxID=861557 RepID=E3S383_PYRTT|nr:hypothetical protein PTT_16895 [Pyrenophora teres f. teres 0-1]
MLKELAEEDEEDEDKAVMSRDRISRFLLTFHQSTNTEAVPPRFETIVRDAAWQSAMERALAVTPPQNPMSLPSMGCWFSESFTRFMLDIQQHNGFVHFDIGNPSVADVSLPLGEEVHPLLVDDSWSKDVGNRKANPLSPLPSWQNMLLGYLDRDED